VRAALSFLCGAAGDREKAWELFCHLAWARHFQLQSSDLRDAYDALRAQGESADPVVAAAALGLITWASFGAPSAATVADFARSVTVLEAHGERRFLPGILAAYAMALSSVDPARAVPAIDRAVALAVETSCQPIESWARMTRCLHYLMGGQPELADRAADELIATSSRHGNEEGITFAMTTKGRLQLMRGDLAAARESFVEAAAYARLGNGTLYGRHDALQGLASVALAQGDDVAARAVLEELVLFLGQRNGISGGELAWGALACLLARSGEKERARHVLAVIRRGVETVPPALKMQFDPTGALSKATADARALLGDPEPLAPELVDVEAALRAAVGAR
jgi:hypothetical protein